MPSFWPPLWFPMTAFEFLPTPATAGRSLRGVLHAELEFDCCALRNVVLIAHCGFPFEGDRADAGNGVHDLVCLPSQAEELLQQGVVCEGHSYVVATDAFVIEVVEGRVIREEQPTP